MAGSLGEALTMGVLGGIQGGAASQLDKLREEAKQAREMSLLGKKHEYAMEIQESGQDFQSGEAKTLAGARAKEVEDLAKSRTREFDKETEMKEEQLRMQGQQLAETKRGNLIQEKILQQKVDDARESGKESLAAQLKIAGDRLISDSTLLDKNIAAALAKQDAGYKAQLENTKQILEATTSQKDDIAREHLARVKETPGYTSASPEMQKLMELEVAANGNISKDILELSAGFGKGKELKGPTAAQIDTTVALLEGSPALKGLGPHAKYSYYIMEATKSANPRAKGLGWGSKDIKGPTEALEMAMGIIQKKVPYSAMMELAPDSQALVYASMTDLEKGKGAAIKEDILTRAGENKPVTSSVLQGVTDTGSVEGFESSGKTLSGSVYNKAEGILTGLRNTRQ